MIFWGLIIPGLALFFLLFFHWFSRKGTLYKIDQTRSARTLPHEQGLSVLSLLLFTSAGVFTGYSIEKGWTLVFVNTSTTISSVLYTIGSFLIAVLLHDLYFYWTHRLLHSPLLFRSVHYLHHRSHDTNPWSAFSFHPLEAIIQAGIIPLMTFVLPLTEVTLFGFSVYIMLMTVYGHCGHELRAPRHKVFYYFNTSLHHFQHHRQVNCNYGIFLNVWDTLLGTNHPTYEADFETMGKRIAGEKERIRRSTPSG